MIQGRPVSIAVYFFPASCAPQAQSGWRMDLTRVRGLPGECHEVGRGQGVGIEGVCKGVIITTGHIIDLRSGQNGRRQGCKGK